jgi:uncharacterized protein YbaA (DUF1428 family)
MPKSKTTYVDGFVLVIAKNKVVEYRKMARLGLKIWMKYGALSYKECVLDDPGSGDMTLPFPTLAKAGKNETVWFSYIEFKSKKHRDQVNAKVMKDPEMQPPSDKKGKKNDVMPFDMKRMAYGGFKVEVGD